MKSVAFDVKGTIEGPKKELVLRLFKSLQSKGVKCVVWSNLYSYATDAIKDNNLENTYAESKRTISEFKEWGLEPFDLAIEDDRSQTWLASKRLIFVDELTDQFVDTLLESIQ